MLTPELMTRRLTRAPRRRSPRRSVSVTALLHTSHPRLDRRQNLTAKLYFDAGHRGDFRYRSTGFDYREQFAISASIYPESEQSGAIITKMSDSVTEQDNHLPRTNGWGLFFANGKINFNLVFSWNYDGFRAETEKALPIKQWHHVLLGSTVLNQYDDRVQIYVNGELQRLKVHQPNLYLYWGQAETVAYRGWRRRGDAIQRRIGRVARIHRDSR